MRVRLKTLMAGPAGSFQPGTIVDLPSDQADELVRSSQAERVETAQLLPVEAAVASASGQATAAARETRGPRSRRGR